MFDWRDEKDRGKTHGRGSYRRKWDDKKRVPYGKYIVSGDAEEK